MTTGQTSAIEELRSGLRASTDPRVIRTRQAIVDAVHSIVASHPDSIGVAEIVRAAGVSRSTFYSHFASLDVLTLYIWEQTQKVDAGGDDVLPGSAREAIESLMRRLVADYSANLVLYATVMRLMTHEVFATAVFVLAEHVRERLEGVEFPPGIDPIAASTHIAGGTLSLLNTWMRDEIDLDEQGLVDHLVGLLPSWLPR